MIGRLYVPICLESEHRHIAARPSPGMVFERWKNSPTASARAENLLPRSSGNASVHIDIFSELPCKSAFDGMTR